ncbi:MAG: SusD/RagB family nutrient-binding outer membrane lipoprotein, partial [Bacteroidetes bacterium]|nr:SusD/RagB family nutrient-binding outer membrane lipoprotein [Bacteroidota bacterium]
MKKLLYVVSGLLLFAGVSSCDNFLDVNSDADFATSDKTTVDLRLPWIQNYFAYAWGTAAMRSNTVGGLLTQTYASGANSNLAAWNPLQSSCTTIYQNWYIASAVNIDPMIKKAEETGAYHYIGAGYCIYAMGFMMMLDLHGELPIQEAFKFKTDPTYDDGKTMYEICMGYLDKAIEYFNKTQETGPDIKLLSKGDLWNNGDVNKWLKLCYGLKARYMLRLSKKAEFNPDAILAALNNAPQSISDNTSMKHYNVAGDQTNFTVADPYQTNALWNCVAYGATQRLTRWYVNLLTNSFNGGSGIVDPRMSKLVPAMMKNVKLDASGRIAGYEWARDVGVDMMTSTIRMDGGPTAVVFATSDQAITYTIADDAARTAFYASMTPLHQTTLDDVAKTVRVVYQRGCSYSSSTDYRRAGDTVYVNMRANSMSTSGRSITDMYYYPAAGFDYVAGTGTFYTRPDSDTDFLT